MKKLSPGSYHRHVPRDPQKNIAYRRAARLVGGRDAAHRRAMMNRCKRDIFFWIDSFVLQYNPNYIGGGSPEVGPFILWDFQREALRAILDCIEKRRDLVIEKSREMGASWLCLLVVVWLFLFHDRKKMLVISRNQDAVDKPEDSDCLFWKIDFILEHLPEWMTGGPLAISRRKLGFRHHKTNSIITGQATTTKSGVGGRCTFMFIDEFGQFLDGFATLAATMSTTGCRIFNGTHKGIGGAFHSLTDPDNIVGQYIRKFVIHWSQHPDKRKGLYRHSPELKRVESLDPTFEFPPQCPQCLEIVEGEEGQLSPCCQRPTVPYQFVLDGSPIGGRFPGLRSPWYDAACRRLPNERAIAEELDINPAGSVAQAFSPILIRDLKARARPPLFVGDLIYDRETGKPMKLAERPGGPVKMWINPTGEGRVPPARYAAGADISMGQGVTPTCMSIGNADTCEKVLEFVDPFTGPNDFAAYAVALCWLFKDKDGMGAMFCWEGNGPGDVFGKGVLKLGYRNIYWRVIEQKFQPKRRADIPGFLPQPANKDVLYTDYQFALRERKFINWSEEALEECEAFRYVNGHIEHPGEKNKNDPSGSGVNHGDRAMADALCCKMMRQLNRHQKRDEPESLKEEETPSFLSWRRRFHEQRRRQDERFA